MLNNIISSKFCLTNFFGGGTVGRFQFSKNGASWGWYKFISLEDFKDPSNGYLVKKKCCIEAQAAVIGSSKME
jgi:hypothetical protein